MPEMATHLAFFPPFSTNNSRCYLGFATASVRNIMARINCINLLKELLGNYSEYIFTKSEVVTFTIIMFSENGDFNNAELWEDLPPWLKEEILSYLSDLNEDSDFCVSHLLGDDEEIKRKFLTVKYWLIKAAIL